MEGDDHGGDQEVNVGYLLASPFLEYFYELGGAPHIDTVDGTEDSSLEPGHPPLRLGCVVIFQQDVLCKMLKRVIPDLVDKLKSFSEEDDRSFNVRDVFGLNLFEIGIETVHRLVEAFASVEAAELLLVLVGDGGLGEDQNLEQEVVVVGFTVGLAAHLEEQIELVLLVMVRVELRPVGDSGQVVVFEAPAMAVPCLEDVHAVLQLPDEDLPIVTLLLLEPDDSQVV